MQVVGKVKPKSRAEVSSSVDSLLNTLGEPPPSKKRVVGKLPQKTTKDRGDIRNDINNTLKQL